MLSPRRETGSSPLARGTYGAAQKPYALARLIPARAGNMSDRTPTRNRPQAHPRSRGEHHCPVSEWKARCGSSPLARGTCIRGCRRCRGSRLIPARAGNIGASYPTRGRRAAHPRSRGEHCFSSAREIKPSGSSPLARGTLHPVTRRGQSARLIPARAGNIRAPCPAIRLATAHPRSRGEHLVRALLSPFPLGSSPLARGT